MHPRTILSSAALFALGVHAPRRVASICAEPYRVSRQEMLQGMSAHAAYSLTSTTTSTRFGAEALLEIVRRRQREALGSTEFLIDQSDWFAAHLETAGVTYAEMSAAARAGFEHHQDASHLGLSRPVAGDTGAGERVRWNLEDRHGDDRAGWARRRRCASRPSRPRSLSRTHEAFIQASVRGAIVPGGAEDARP